MEVTSSIVLGIEDRSVEGTSVYRRHCVFVLLCDEVVGVAAQLQKALPTTGSDRMGYTSNLSMGSGANTKRASVNQPACRPCRRMSPSHGPEAVPKPRACRSEGHWEPIFSQFVLPFLLYATASAERQLINIHHRIIVNDGRGPTPRPHCVPNNAAR